MFSYDITLDGHHEYSEVIEYVKGLVWMEVTGREVKKLPKYSRE